MCVDVVCACVCDVLYIAWECEALPFERRPVPKIKVNEIYQKSMWQLTKDMQPFNVT